MIFGLIAAWATCLVILTVPEGPTRFAKVLLSPFRFGDPDTLPAKFVFRVAFAVFTLLLIFYGFAQLFPDRFHGPGDRAGYWG